MSQTKLSRRSRQALPRVFSELSVVGGRSGGEAVVPAENQRRPTCNWQIRGCQCSPLQPAFRGCARRSHIQPAKPGCMRRAPKSSWRRSPVSSQMTLPAGCGISASSRRPFDSAKAVSCLLAGLMPPVSTAAAVARCGHARLAIGRPRCRPSHKLAISSSRELPHSVNHDKALAETEQRAVWGRSSGGAHQCCPTDPTEIGWWGARLESA